MEVKREFDSLPLNPSFDKLRNAKGNLSKRRNPLIADLFRRIEMVEAWGRGMPLILEQEPGVQFSEIAGIFIAAFGRPSFKAGFLEENSPDESSVKTVEKTVEKTAPTVEKTVEKITSGVGETVGQILQYIQENPNITGESLSQKTGLSVRGVEWNLAKMKKAGLIKRVGPDKGGHWEVVE
jgi:ATP-dependent DNA helicase RecG